MYKYIVQGTSYSYDVPDIVLSTSQSYLYYYVLMCAMWYIIEHRYLCTYYIQVRCTMYLVLRCTYKSTSTCTSYIVVQLLVLLISCTDVRCTMYIVRCTGTMYTVHMYIVRTYIVQGTYMYIVHRTWCINLRAPRALAEVRCTCVHVRCTMYDVRCTMYDVPRTMYDVRCTIMYKQVRCTYQQYLARDALQQLYIVRVHRI